MMCPLETSPEAPKVTIGMPLYNAASHLERALTSLLAQSYSHLEIIISDNASTDATAAICKRYTEQDSRIQYYCQPENIGAIGNFAFVLEKAESPYFMWAAYDDFWEPDFVKALVEDLEAHHGSDVAMSSVKRVFDDGKLQDIIAFHGKDDPNKMRRMDLFFALLSGKLYHLWIYGLYRTPFLKKAMAHPLPPVYGGDRLFMCQVALGTRFRYVKEILHIRTTTRKPLAERYPEEKAFQNLTQGILKGGFALCHIIHHSQVIPPIKKWIIPLAVLRYYWTYRQILLQAPFSKRKPKQAPSKLVEDFGN